MRLFIALILCTTLQSCKAQKSVLDNISSDIKILTFQVKYIMDTLSIPQRIGYQKDYPELEIRVNPKNKGFVSSAARKGEGPSLNKVLLDTLNRFYVQPIIFISPLIHSIVYNNKDTTERARIRAHSSLIHELTHYYQLTYMPRGLPYPTTKEELEAYQNLPSEIESYAVQSYFLLYHLDREKLNSIMGDSKNKKERLRIICNAAYSILNG